MPEALAEVLGQPAVLVDRPRPLAGRQRVDAAAPDLADQAVQLIPVLNRNPFDQQVEVQRPAFLELDLNEPLQIRPASTDDLAELLEVAVGLLAGEVLAGGQDRVELRPLAVERVEQQRLDGLSDVAGLAVAAQVRGLAATLDQLARLLRKKPQMLRPTRASRPPRVGNSL